VTGEVPEFEEASEEAENSFQDEEKDLPF